MARYNTTATASFRTLSPNTTANKSGSTRRSAKMANTVTGSVAPMMLPKSIASTNAKLCASPIKPSRYIPSPNAKLPTNVPTNAKYEIFPRLRKKGSASMA